MKGKKEKKDREKKKWTFWKVVKVFFVSFGKLIWNIIKIPFWLVKGIVQLSISIGGSHKISSENKKRERMNFTYAPLKILKTKKGNLNTWEDKMMKSESAIGIILGARGTGKTAFGLKWAENLHAKTGKKISAMGFQKNEMPLWINVSEKVEEVPNDSFLLIDEGGVLFSSRESMNKQNKFLSELLFISRHKNLSVLFISQNSANLEINALRQADYLVLKPSSLLQQEFERKIIQKLYSETKKDFDKFKSETGAVYIHASDFQGFVSNSLPSFWSTEISKSFRKEAVE